MAPKFTVAFGVDVPAQSDGRLDAPAFRRNSGPILQVMSRALEGLAGHAVEVGSGTGQHVATFARAFPHLTWWPSDPQPAHRRSIEAWRKESGLPNLMAPVDLDASRSDWPLSQPGFPPNEELAAIVSINVLHIAPWSVAEGLLAAAARYLAPDGRLILYGPYRVNGAHTAPSNAAFDEALRAQNPEWGVRDVDDIAVLAAANRLALRETVAMPANNLVLVLSR